MNHYKNIISTSCLALLLSPTLSTADETETITVTANRMAQTADETLASVSVITRKDIETSQSQEIIDLLRLQAGIDVARTGGPGAGTSVFLRGTNSNSTLVLIDGVRASSSTSGSFAWQSMSTTDIDRIEIVRGPRATQYGSDAIGGVIQIFTRKNKSLQLRAQAGSYNTQLIEAGIGGGDRLKYSVNLSGKNTDGFSSINEKDTFGSYNPDDDGFKNRSLSASLDWSITDKTEFTIKGWDSRGNKEYDDGAVAANSKTDNATLDLRLTNQTMPNWKQTFSMGGALDDIEDTSSRSSQITTNRFMADWQNDFTIGLNHMATIGLSTVHEKVDSYNRITQTTVYNESTSNNGLFGLWQSSIGINNLNISARVDDYESFGTHSTGQIAWGIQAGKKLRFTASLGTAFKAPSLNELYHPGYGGSYGGNPDLKPEESITSELGAHYSPDKQQNLGLNIYRTKVDNLIAYSSKTPHNVENINEARIDGLEFLYSFKTGPWVLSTNFTLQKAVNDVTKSDLLRRARQKFNVEFRHLFGTKGDLGLSWNYVGPREDFAATLDSYNLVDFSGSYLVMKSLRLEGRIENVLDEDYEHAYSYNTPGRSFYAGIRYTMGK